MALLNLERLRNLKAAGRYQDAHNLYVQLVAMRETCAEACLIGGQAAKRLGNLAAARDALESCLEREPEGTVLGMARFGLGEVMRLLGEPHEAVRYLTAFLDGILEYPQLADVGIGPALFNRGMALRQTNQLDDSLYDYAAACEEFRREGMSVYLCMALQNRAWVASLLGDSVLTRVALDEARPLCNNPALQWHQRLGEAFYAAIDFDRFDTETRRKSQWRALELCQVIFQHEGTDIPAEVRCQSFWLAGRISLDLGEIDDAGYFGQQAMDHAVTIPVADTRSLYDAADLLRQVHAARSQVNRTGP